MHATPPESKTAQLDSSPSEAVRSGNDAAHDLAPLAWVMEEVRRSLEAAGAALRLPFPDAHSQARSSTSAAQAPTLPLARVQLHQAASALEMIGIASAARVIRAMESVIQGFQDAPERYGEAEVIAFERAGFAVAEFLEGLLGAKPWSGVMLFPQYRQLLEILGSQRIHPADLWQPPHWAWESPPGEPSTQLAGADPALRGRMDQAVLRLVKGGERPGATVSDLEAARDLSRMCADLTGAAADPAVRSLWWLTSGFFEALALSLIPLDRFAKRTASQVLLHYAHLARGEAVASDRLGQDLAFFCAQAVPGPSEDAPHLAAVRRAWNLSHHQPVAYDQPRLGRFDPRLLAQVRRRLVAVRESWSALTGGDSSRLQSTCHQLTQLHEALVRLHLPFEPLADVLVSMGQEIAERGQVPPPELAMEVATAILFLEATCQDFDPVQEAQEPRLRQLADRLARARQGAPSEPLPAWIEELYRGASHRQTIGSVVDELRASLIELEKELDSFVRDTRQRERLQSVPGRLVQMRGILSVLGLDHAAQAVAHIRDTVQSLLEAPNHPIDVDFEALGHNLGALGFLIDMLSYQPSLARKLFLFDPVRAELRPVMGRVVRVSPPAPVVQEDWSLKDVNPLGAAGLPDEASTRESVFLSEPEPCVVPGVDQASEPVPAPENGAQDEAAPAQGTAIEIADASRPAMDFDSEDRIKVIGSLRIEIDLFNVYLNEADEWSRCLQVDLSEWMTDPRQRVPDSVVLLAHSLCGSSATVGFRALSDLARQLESSLQRTQRLTMGTPEHARAYADAAEEIRRLLHQFAAGFLPEVRSQVIAALEALDAMQDPREPQLPSVAPESGSRLGLEVEAETEAVTATETRPDPLSDLLIRSASALDPPLPPHAVAAVTDGLRSFDPDLFVFFEEEALELLPRLGNVVRQWHADTRHPHARDEVMRILHTFKGSARLAGARALGDMAHELESRVDGLGPGPVEEGIRTVMDGVDQLQSVFEALRAQAFSQPACEALVNAPAPVAVPVQPTAEAVASDAPDGRPGPRPGPGPGPAAPVPVSAELTGARGGPGTGPASLARPAQALVRVKAALLDRLMNQAGEVMITRARLAADMGQLRGALQELTGNLARLRYQLRDLELQSELQMQSRQVKDCGNAFDPLEFDRFTQVQELTRMLAESVGDVATVQRTLQRAADSAEGNLQAQAHQARELQRDLLRTRMIEFDSIADRLHRVVRLAAQETSKQVTLAIRGGSIEMDRSILDRMTPAFEHLLRNAVAHGVEAPDLRIDAGKPATGQVRIALSQAGNDVTLQFEDDGAGLDLARIREKARAMSLLAPDRDIDEVDAAQLIFAPGFSTASEVSALAGRGIGMDAVRSEVQSVGGRIESRSKAGIGTCFEIVLPLTTAITQIVMLRCGAKVFGVPVTLVEVVESVSPAVYDEAGQTGRFMHGAEALAFHASSALLQEAPSSNEGQARSVPVVILRSAAQRLALHVDEVMGHQEVVVKHLGPQLARLPGLVGVTVLPSGAVVLIYNPVALAAIHGPRTVGWDARNGQVQLSSEAAPARAQPGTAVASLPPLVLVVDDSITVRRVTQRLLEREGYRVALASDGLQALDQLAQETPCVVLSDIEMPRMDGFELARHVRADARCAKVPIVMISSRTATKHREHARELGVDHYLGKPFPEEELLSLVRRYAVRPPAS